MPKNDLAILRTHVPIMEFQQLYLPICPYEIPPRERFQQVFGTCGMGKANRSINGPIVSPILKGLFSSQQLCNCLLNKFKF